MNLNEKILFINRKQNMFKKTPQTQNFNYSHLIDSSCNEFNFKTRGKVKVLNTMQHINKCQMQCVREFNSQPLNYNTN